MSPLQAILLGILQGITEFLPVSSSGHLVVFQHYLGIKQNAIFFDILLHVATLFAVIIFFKREIFLLFLSLFKLKDKTLSTYRQLIIALFAGTVPTFLLGAGFYKIKDFLSETGWFTALMFILTGILLWLGEKKSKNSNPGREKVTVKDALFIGFFQGIAIIPGISRSGATISSALFRGLKRDVSFKFSFLLSIPAIIGALLVEGKNTDFKSFSLPFLAGGGAAFVCGVLALLFLREILRKEKLSSFSLYLWTVGGIILIMEVLNF
ncbi:undecaprenyl-diphosphate phosphatase [Candidatus Aerophobetes bacterium]|nr:undecaprenyl-diphosphate phosphatase [Candidatus Aerophobetes bacterium]